MLMVLTKPEIKKEDLQTLSFDEWFYLYNYITSIIINIRTLISAFSQLNLAYI